MVKIEGQFARGEPVEVVGPEGAVFARGIARFSAQDLAQMAGRRRSSRSVHSKRPLSVGAAKDDSRDGEVIHRDELVITGEDSWRS